MKTLTINLSEDLYNEIVAGYKERFGKQLDQTGVEGFIENLIMELSTTETLFTN